MQSNPGIEEEVRTDKGVPARLQQPPSKQREDASDRSNYAEERALP